MVEYKPTAPKGVSAFLVIWSDKAEIYNCIPLSLASYILLIFDVLFDD